MLPHRFRSSALTRLGCGSACHRTRQVQTIDRTRVPDGVPKPADIGGQARTLADVHDSGGRSALLVSSNDPASRRTKRFESGQGKGMNSTPPMAARVAAKPADDYGRRCTSTEKIKPVTCTDGRQRT